MEGQVHFSLAIGSVARRLNKLLPGAAQAPHERDSLDQLRRGIQQCDLRVELVDALESASDQTKSSTAPLALCSARPRSSSALVASTDICPSQSQSTTWSRSLAS